MGGGAGKYMTENSILIDDGSKIPPPKLGVKTPSKEFSTVRSNCAHESIHHTVRLGMSEFDPWLG